MADEETDLEQALRRAADAHRKFTEVSEQAEHWRQIRLGAMTVAATSAGATQAQLAEALGISQPMVSKILASSPAGG